MTGTRRRDALCAHPPGRDRAMSLSASPVPARLDAARACAVLDRVRQACPRVHCLTNTVAQNLTANMLLAFGAVPSMAIHPEEIGAVAQGAGAILVNLGTITAESERAVPTLLAVARAHSIPLVLDPVFVELSPLRRRIAAEALRLPGIVVRGNATEMGALGFELAAANATRVTTGMIDRIESAGTCYEISHGHRLMAQVTGIGCAAGALVAACCAVEADTALAAAAALTAYGIAGEIAAARSRGPGSFAPELIDAVAGLDGAALKTWMEDRR